MRTCQQTDCTDNPSTTGRRYCDAHRATPDSRSQTCTTTGCDRAMRAKGLCATHYNELNRKPNPVSEYNCPTCGEVFVKESARANRYKHVFCSADCNVLYQMDHLDRRSGTLKAAATRTAKKLANPPHIPSPQCTVTYSDCATCGQVICHRPSRRAYCSTRCSDSARRARKGKRHNIRRIAIFERDGYLCWICGQPCDPTLSLPSRMAATVDHLVPQSLGGTHEHDNLATAHMVCNSRRGASWGWPVAS